MGRGTNARTRRRALGAGLLAVGLAAVGLPTIAALGSGSPNGPAVVDGTVTVRGAPAGGWRVELRATGPGGSRVVARATTDTRGRFRVRTHPRRDRDVVQYLVATHGPTRTMMLALGPPAETPPRVVVNELGTVATIWTHAQLLAGDTIRGNAVGLRAAGRNVPNLVDLPTGQLGAVVLDTANLQTNTAATMGTLAGLLGDCLTDGCADLFALAAPPGEPLPTDTVAALADVARNPWHNVVEIFDLLEPATDGRPDNPTYLPTLLYPPTGWTLSLAYTDGGFSAPGGLKIDGQGSVWTNNNFVPGSQSALLDAGPTVLPDPGSYSGLGVTKLASNGIALSPRTGFLGGGTFGAAFGIAIDRSGNAWVGNFAGNSLSKLAPDGTPLSRSSRGYSSAGGFHDPALSSPQDTIVTADGSIWTANLGGDTVSQVVGGDPASFRTWGGAHCVHRLHSPWGLTSDAAGRVFVTNLAGRSVSMIDPASATDGCPSATYPLHAGAAPQGIAVDSRGNLWVADTYGLGKVTFLDASNGYAATSFDGDGTTVGPWGIAVDGSDNVWIADFFGKRIVNLCGAAGNCPEGMRTLGARISPAGFPYPDELGNGGGYGANGSLESITAINLDQAGNVWVANNFNDDRVCLAGAGVPNPAAGGNTSRLESLQTSCAGDGVVVMLGAATPVAAPMIGPPVAP